jgi:acyl carrier protein
VHSAGVLDDAGLLLQGATRFARVFAPKVRGGYLLDVMTRVDPLDFFVLFSSAAAVLGSGGQSNHAAANTVLDTLARERRNRGLPALSINWGPWKDIGAAAALGITERLADEGLMALSPAQGLVAFERLLQRAECQVAVLSIDWDRCLQHSGPLARSAFLSDAARGAVARATTTDAPIQRQEDLRQLVLETTVGRWRDVVEAFVSERVLRALGLDPARTIDPRTPLGELGLDSLLAIELRNALARSLGTSLPATLLFDYPTLDTLTDYVMRDVLELEVAPAGPGGLEAPADLVGSIEELADEEVDRLLAARAKGRA